MGARAAIRSATEIQALCFYQTSSREYLAKLRQNVTKALDERDSKFGDYRTSHGKKEV